MANYVIGVGGTGSRCLDALVRSLCLGIGQEANDEIRLLLVDADLNNPRRVEIENLLVAYNKVHSTTVVQFPDKPHPFWRKCDVFRSKNGHQSFMWAPHSRIRAGQADKSLRSLFNANGGLEREIASVFLDEAPLDMRLNDGFNAQPGVGAAVISLLADPKWSEGNQDLMSEFLQQLQQESKANQVIHVVVTGSVFGGTGAAGIPQLARSIRKLFPAGDAVNLKLHAVVTVPYFVPLEPSQAEIPAEYRDLVSAGLYADNSGNALRAADVLSVLRSEPLYDSICILGEPDPMRLTQWAGGGAQQDNLPHFVEVLAANTILELIDEEQILQQSAGGTGFVFGRPDDKQQMNLAQWPRGQKYAQAFNLQLAHAIFMKFEVEDLWREAGAENEIKQLDDWLELLATVYKWWFLTLKQSDGLVKLTRHTTLMHEVLQELELHDPARFIYDNADFNVPGPYQLAMQELCGKQSNEIHKIMMQDIASSPFTAVFVDSFQAIQK